MKRTRPPIVTVLGHVDHGKTTLLDSIRKSDIAAREAGGITQGIGASILESQEGNITFVDTPGHAAFSRMRSRGAKVADIALLVVSADDGVMPQTREALNYIREAGIPFIVVFTKTDLPSANIEKARGSVESEGVLFEGRGGDTPAVSVSAKSGDGIDNLLEMIRLVADVSGIVADSQAPLEARVIETNKDRRGPIVSVVVREGTLSVGDLVQADDIKTKVRGLFDYRNKPMKSAGPSEPAIILGFSDLPEVGSAVTPPGIATQERDISTKFVPEVGDNEIALVVKASSAGALEAVLGSLPEKAIVIRSGVGDITESDIFFAKSANGKVVAFEVKVPGSVKKLAETEGVTIDSFTIIYELMDMVNKILTDNTATILGKAAIMATFPYESKVVAGCKVLEGRIAKSDKILVMRGEAEVGQSHISSIRREKQIINEAKAGEECGILLSPPLDFTIGDMIVSVQ